jgi:hypothetical protein
MALIAELLPHGDQRIAMDQALLQLGIDGRRRRPRRGLEQHAQLGETTTGPRATIWCAVRTLGPERAQAFVAQALEAEANGGMLIPDGTRKRTLGGIFFYLVRTQVTTKALQATKRTEQVAAVSEG